ncbi:lysophospholipase [Sporosarcina newyorkensis]|uniref:alpha/beta hydrolase n=1 Tax=Sporosarcina newyorkensis TaxID=759851 RepID=UPI003D006C39
MEEYWVEARDGTKLYSSFHKSAESGKARVHLIHGIAEHSGRYGEFINYLVEQGYVVVIHDQRGHGKTAGGNKLPYGDLGDQVSFDHLIDDVFEVIQFYQHEYPDLPVVLFGHSMGSFVARRFIQLYGNVVDKVILSGTGSNSKIISYAGKLLAEWREDHLPNKQPDEFLNQLVFGNFSKPFAEDGSSFAWLSRDRETVRGYEQDEACGFVPTSQLFRVLLEGLNTIEDQESVRNIPKELPILLVSGTDDPVGDRAKGVWKVAKQFNEAGLQYVTVQLYEGGRHEMLQETNRLEVFQNIIGWMKHYE